MKSPAEGADTPTWEQKFKSHFSATLNVCVDIWVRCIENGIRHFHLLWALYHLKVYRTESVAAGTLIHLEDRWDDWNMWGPTCYVDGSNCKVWERRPISKSDFSHKFKRAGIRYEVATAFGVSKIVHIGGGVPCGDWPDLKLARHSLLPRLALDECVAGDKGYREEVGNGRFWTPIDNPDCNKEFDFHNKLLQRMGAHHETVNKRLKDFGVLAQCFRGDRSKHPDCFFACACITQIYLRYKPLFHLA
ncbi:hypothetical protein DFJ73DRAFT_767230 [Zopfochytrium polystomum]|nr:hypothetical protein DFJ73DRAFT_767230 [Zopfochytrium polystomum]